MRQTDRKGKQLKMLFSKAALIVIFLAGFLTMCYPFYINALNDFIDDWRIEQVRKRTEEEAKEQAKEAKAEMEKRNAELAKNGLIPAADPFSEGTADIMSDAYLEKHLIGAVNIPKININIPLFDTTNDEILEVGAGVLQGTSAPIGGENTHSVISAHSGLANRKLFTDLEEVTVGDVFILTVFEENLAYQVDNIDVVKPEDTSILDIEAGRDIVTLVTCTPYMINSHRLLVTGHRVPYTGAITRQINKSNRERWLQHFLVLFGVCLAVILLLLLLYRILHTYLLRRRSFDLAIRLKNRKNQPIVGKRVALYTKSGKKVITRNHRPLTAKTNKSGLVVFRQLPGGIYRLKARKLSMLDHKVGLKKLKQTSPKGYPTRKQKRTIKNGKKIIKIRVK